jgi:hypothetical protein|tara:strand:+ start:74 stop:178 length:105 start_codon:yes stop_codon:yes gene_type:complete
MKVNDLIVTGLKARLAEEEAKQKAATDQLKKNKL